MKDEIKGLIAGIVIGAVVTTASLAYEDYAADMKHKAEIEAYTKFNPGRYVSGSEFYNGICDDRDNNCGGIIDNYTIPFDLSASMSDEELSTAKDEVEHRILELNNYSEGECWDSETADGKCPPGSKLDDLLLDQLRDIKDYDSKPLDPYGVKSIGPKDGKWM